MAHALGIADAVSLQVNQVDDAETIAALSAELAQISAENAALETRLASVLREIDEQASPLPSTEDAAEVLTRERRANDLIASVPGLIWEARGMNKGVGNVLSFVSDYITPMLGYRPDECVGNPGFWRGVVHPSPAALACREGSRGSGRV